MPPTNAAARLLEALTQVPVLPILRGLSPAEAPSVGEALVAAGIRALEVPLNGPHAVESVARLRASLDEEILVGVGTVLQAEQITEAAQAGARFAVMPHTDLELLSACATYELAAVPGVATPTEAFAALRAGACALKLFPAQSIPPSAIKAWRAVLPSDVTLIAVGGLGSETLEAYGQAGVQAFGVGSAIYSPGRTAGQVQQAAQRAIQAALRAVGEPTPLLA